MRRLILILLCWPVWAGAANLFVIQGGAGDADGSSLAHACNGPTDADCSTNAADGSTVYICGDQVITSSWANANTGTVTWTGDCSGHGYPNTATITNSGGAYNLNWTGSGSATFKHLVFGGGASSDCLNVDGSGDLTLEFSTVQDCTDDGIDVDNTTADVTVRYSTIQRAARHGLIAGAAASNAARLTVRFNTIANNGTSGASNNFDGVGVDDGVGFALIEYNTITGQKSGLGSGIDIQDGSNAATVKHTARFNWIEGAEGPCISSTGTASSLFYGNINIGCNNGALPKGTDATATQEYYNNIFFGSTGSLFKIATTGTGAAKNVIAKNNVFVNAGTWFVANDVDGSTFTMDNNAFFGTGDGFNDSNSASGCNSGCTFAEWQADGKETSGINADPRFIGGTNPTTAEGFRLSASSPLRAAGTYVGSLQDYGNRRFKFPPSIGAWEAASGDAASSRQAAQSR